MQMPATSAPAAMNKVVVGTERRSSGAANENISKRADEERALDVEAHRHEGAEQAADAVGPGDESPSGGTAELNRERRPGRR